MTGRECLILNGTSPSMVRDPPEEETGKKEPEVREEKSPHIRLSSHPGAHCICAYVHKMAPPLFYYGCDGGVRGLMRLKRSLPTQIKVAEDLFEEKRASEERVLMGGAHGERTKMTQSSGYTRVTFSEN